MSDKPSDEHVEYYSHSVPEGYILCVREVSHNKFAVWAQREAFPSPPGTRRVKRIPAKIVNDMNRKK